MIFNLWLLKPLNLNFRSPWACSSRRRSRRWSLAGGTGFGTVAASNWRQLFMENWLKQNMQMSIWRFFIEIYPFSFSPPIFIQSVKISSITILSLTCLVFLFFIFISTCSLASPQIWATDSSWDRWQTHTELPVVMISSNNLNKESHINYVNTFGGPERPPRPHVKL